MLEKILMRIHPDVSVSLWDSVRSLFRPSHDLQRLLWLRLQPQLQPAVHQMGYSRSLRFSAVAVMAVLVLRVIPLVILPSQTLADSPVTVLSTKGQASILMGGLWQPVTHELDLTKSATIQTKEEDEASVIVHDDFVVRATGPATFALHDLSDRPSASEHDPTMTLHEGGLWFQGFVPAYASHGVTIQTSQATVVIHEGSVSIRDANGIVEISVWNRRATVLRGGSVISLVAGERLRLWEGNIPLVERIRSSEYEDLSVREHLNRDAAHQIEIAHLQLERRAAAAGILPSSPLYAVKRAAEAVDVLFAFTEEERARKRLGHAQTRLNEAALALLGEEPEQATAPLQEFKEAVLSVASGTGDTVVQAIIHEQLAQASADLAAARPTDDLYALKETVLETSNELAGPAISIVSAADVRVADTVSDLTLHVGESDEKSEEMLSELQPMLSDMEGDATPLSQSVREEVEAGITIASESINAEEPVGEQSMEYVSLIPSDAAMSEEELQTYVEAAEVRIFTAENRIDRRVRLLGLLRGLEGNANQGPILRRLQRELPAEGLALYVEMEIERVRKERAIEQAN